MQLKKKGNNIGSITTFKIINNLSSTSEDPSVHFWKIQRIRSSGSDSEISSLSIRSYKDEDDFMLDVPRVDGQLYRLGAEKLDTR